MVAPEVRRARWDAEAVERHVKVERRRERADAEMVRRLWAEGVRCDVCWGPVPLKLWARTSPRPTTGQWTRTCGPACARRWVLARYHLDADERARQRRTMAHNILRTGTGSRTYAHNVLAGTVAVRRPEPEPLPGSAAGRVLAEVAALRAANVASYGTPA